MLVEFERSGQGRCDEDEIETPYKISINAAAVEAVFEDRDHDNSVIIRLGGRGLTVRGTYNEVLLKLNA
jgi:hypothetical protein